MGFVLLIQLGRKEFFPLLVEDPPHVYIPTYMHTY